MYVRKTQETVMVMMMTVRDAMDATESGQQADGVLYLWLL
jgi:hypothetical protein